MGKKTLLNQITAVVFRLKGYIDFRNDKKFILVYFSRKKGSYIMINLLRGNICH